MLKLLTAALALVFTTSAFAVTEEDLTDENKAKITTMLEAEGYEVGKFKIEDEMYEVYAKKDGQKYEVFLNDDFEIVEVKED